MILKPPPVLLTMLYLVLLSPAFYAWAGEPLVVRIDSELAKFLALEELHKRFPDSRDSTASVESKGSAAYPSFQVCFDWPVPAGYWAAELTMKAHVDGNGKVTIDYWRDDADGLELPATRVIAYRFLNTPRTGKPEPGRAIQLISRWLKANRNSDDIDYAYSDLAWAYKKANRSAELVDVLNRERPHVTNPRGIYCIYEELAKAYEAQGSIASASEMWDMARQSMANGSHPWFTTRRALPLKEQGHLFLRAGDLVNAQKYFELFIATEFGRADGSREYLALGTIFESQSKIEKAEKLYREFLDMPRKPYANPAILEQIKEPFRDRLKLIDARRRMNTAK